MPNSGAPLTDLERALLEFEQSHPRHSRAKEEALRDRFGVSTARYYQILGTLVETPAALIENPLLVGRLRRVREQRRSRRFRGSAEDPRD